MKRLDLGLALLSAVAGAVCAQEPAEEAATPSRLEQYLDSGMELAGVRVPYYDDQGALKAQLYGGHAKVLDGGVADIANLRIDVFDKGRLAMTLFAPQCFSRMVEQDGRKTLLADSEGDVLVEMEQVLIAGKGFRFTSEGNRFEILRDARVLVKESARKTRGLGL